ncbi:MAG TPA: LamG-like jellyroll fold domain-containing protein [Thermoguttaceae bacterium]|nr:LamG-like jellyroll fold domain-containing protein [Thermoguttaceae bacterium]
MARSKPKPLFLRRGHSLAQDLVGAWLLTEGCGQTVRDGSGLGSHATMVNMPPATSWVTSPFGPAIQLPDSATATDCVQTAVGLADLNPTGEMTLVAWAWHNGFSSATNAYWNMAAKGSVFQIGFGLCVYHQAPNFTNVDFWTRGAALTVVEKQMTNAEFSAFWPAGTWKCVAGVLQGGKGRLYVDAVEAASEDSMSAPGSTLNLPFCIGGSSNGHAVDRTWPGRLALVILFRRALAVDELARLYAEPCVAFRPRRRTAFVHRVSGPYRVASGQCWHTGATAGQTFGTGQTAGQIHG